MSCLRLRRVPVLPDDAHPPGYQNSGGCQKSTQTWKKQPVTFHFSIQAPYSPCESWEFLHIDACRVPAPSFYLKGQEDLYMVNVSKEGQVFRCEICGNVVIVKEAGGGELICCGEPMQLESE
jgi:desulfoferrodoxin-like iron-binding protein